MARLTHMKRTLIRTALSTLAITSLLATVGCSQGPVDTKDFDEAQEPLAEQTAAPAVEKQARKGCHDPAAMIEKLDENKDGVLQLSELPKRKARFFEGADTDKDGTLSVAELEAHKLAEKGKRFARIDSDNDGFVTEAEAGRRWDKLKVADADNDGKLTQAELEQAHENGTLKFKGRHGKRGFRGKHRMNPEAWFDKLDENKNGTLELAEIPERKRSHLEKADKNGDQVLSKDELKAHVEAKRKEFEQRKPAMEIDDALSPTL